MVRILSELGIRDRVQAVPSGRSVEQTGVTDREGMVALTRRDADVKERVLALVNRTAEDGSPAVRAGARRPLAEHDGRPRAVSRDGLA